MATELETQSEEITQEDIDLAVELHNALQSENSRGAQTLKTVELPSELAQSSPELGGGESEHYRDLRNQLKGQISVLTALYGAQHENCATLTEKLKQAEQKVTTGTVSEAEEILERAVALGAKAVSEGKARYARQRLREEQVENQRRELVKRRLALESDARLLHTSIEKLRGDVQVTNDRELPTVVSKLQVAEIKHTAMLKRLDSEAVAAIGTTLKLDDATSKLEAANQSLEETETARDDGNRFLEEAKTNFKNILQAAKKTGTATASHFQRYETLLQNVNDEVRLPPSVLAPFLDDLRTARSLLIRAAASEPQDTALITQTNTLLDKVDNEFNQAVESNLRGYDEAANSLALAQQAIVGLTAVALPADTKLFVERLNAVQAQIEKREFEAAKEAANTLKREIENKTNELAPSKQAWETKTRGVQEKLDQQRELLEGTKPPHDPKALSTDYLRLFTAVTQRSMSYADGVTGIDEVLLKVNANSIFLADREDLGTDLNAWKERIAEASERVKSAITNLQEACNAGESVVKQLIAPYQQRHEKLREQWEEIARTLTDTQQEAAVKALNDFGSLAEEISNLKTNSGALEEEIGKADRADALAALANIEKGIGTQFDQLRNYGATGLEALRKQYAELVKSTGTKPTPDAIREATLNLVSGPVRELVRRVEEEKNRIAQLKLAAKSALEQAQSELTKFENAVEDHESGFLGAIRRNLKVNEKKEYKAYIEVLQGEVAALKPMVAVEFADLLEEAKNGLDALKSDIQDAFKGLKDILVEDKEGAKVKTSLSALKHTIEDEVTRVSDEENVKARLPKTAEALCKQMTELKEKLGQELLSDSQKKFAAMKKEADELILRAAGVARKLEEFNTQANLLEQRLSSPSEPVKDFESVVAQLQSKINSARAAAEKEDGIDSASLILNDVESALTRTQNGGDLAAMVREIDQTNNAKVQAKTEWEAEVAAFNRELYNPYQEAIKKDMAPGARFFAFFRKPEKFAEIEKLRKMATDSADKGDYDMGRYQLSLARSRMEFHMKFPESQDAAVLKDVASIKRKWRGAVEGYRSSLDATANKIAGTVRNEGDGTAADAILDSASKLRTLLASDAFDGIVDELTSATGEAARRQRESGLARIREIRQTLEDPRIRMISTHKFDDAPEFDGHFAVGKALLDFEKTILLTAGS